jgi:hypothetical protein
LEIHGECSEPLRKRIDPGGNKSVNIGAFQNRIGCSDNRQGNSCETRKTIEWPLSCFAEQQCDVNSSADDESLG